MDDCRKAFDEWWKVPNGMTSESLKDYADLAFFVWQAAWKMALSNKDSDNG